MPAAQLIAQMMIHDMGRFEEYASLAAPVLEKYSGKISVGRLDRQEILEGDEKSAVVVIAKFPTYDRALDFYHSEEYRSLIAMRRLVAEGTVALVEEQ